MKLGQTQDLVMNANMSKFGDRVEIKEGINTHRVLRGPFLSRSVYWPTIVNEQGQLNQRMKSVIVPKYGSDLLKTLAATEKEFRLSMGEKDPRSQFTPSNSFLYLIFNRDEAIPDGELPQVRVAAYKQTVYTRLEEIQNERSTKDQTMLKNGLIFMYNVQIKKTVGDQRRKQYTTKYTVDVDTENNPVQGQIPAVLLEMPVDKMMAVLDENNVWKAIFTPEEIEAIEQCTIDLESETKPNSEEEILVKLKEFPIFLGAKDPNTGQFLFPQNEQFMKFLKSKELPILEAAGQLPPAQGQPPATGQAPPVAQTEVSAQNEQAPPVVTQPQPPTAQKINVNTGGEKAASVETQNGGKIERWGGLGK